MRPPAASGKGRANPVAKYHLIEVSLAARIREGSYDQSGLPGERDLAAEFMVARVTIRSALKRLEEHGLVVRRHGRGTIAVSGRGAARRLLPDHVDRFLDRGRKDVRKVVRLETVPATPAWAEALELEPGAMVLRVARIRSNGGVPLTYTEAIVPLWLAQHITRAALNRKSFIAVLEGAGVRIGNAEQGASAEGASPAVSIALGVPLSAPVLNLARVLRDEAGRPIQYLRGWYRADRFALRMSLSKADDVTRVWFELQ